MPTIIKNVWKAKIIGILFFVLFFSLLPLPGKRAAAWTNIPATLLKQSLEVAYKQIMLAINGAAKQAAVKMINQNVSAIVSGSGGGGPKFITDWNAALSINPKKEAALYIEQLSKRSTRMIGSSFYKSVDSLFAMNQFEGVGADGLAQYFQSPRFIDSANAGSGSGSAGNYAASLKEIGQGVADSMLNEASCAITYEGNPENMFADGTFKNFSKFMSGNNNPWAYQTCLENTAAKKLAEKKEVAATKAISYGGFEGAGIDGLISYPGSLLKEKMANVENMGNEMIANAQGIPEIITASVIKMSTDAINNGIGNVQSQIQKGVSNQMDKLNTQVQNQVTNFGPGALFGKSSMP